MTEKTGVIGGLHLPRKARAVSAKVMPISMKVCTMVELCPRIVLFPFGGDIFRGHEMWGQERGSGGPFLASQTPIFCHLTANISKTVSHSIICKLEINISLMVPYE